MMYAIVSPCFIFLPVDFEFNRTAIRTCGKLTSVKLAADSTFFNEYSHTYLCRRSSLVCLIELDELYLVV